jgi:hypothetical protein
MPHGFRCAKKTLLRKQQTKPFVPQLHTGMRLWVWRFRLSIPRQSHKHATQVQSRDRVAQAELPAAIGA